MRDRIDHIAWAIVAPRNHLVLDVTADRSTIQGHVLVGDSLLKPEVRRAHPNFDVVTCAIVSNARVITTAQP